MFHYDFNNLTYIKENCLILKINFQIFTANNDATTPVTNYLPTPITTSYLRLYQEEMYTYAQAGALRMEILGCQGDGKGIYTIPDESYF